MMASSRCGWEDSSTPTRSSRSVLSWLARQGCEEARQVLADPAQRLRPCKQREAIELGKEGAVAGGEGGGADKRLRVRHARGPPAEQRQVLVAQVGVDRKSV